MASFFVLDGAGDHKLESEIDEFGEEIYNYIDEKLLADEKSNSKKIYKCKNFESFDQAKDMLKDRLYVCKLKGYPEICLKSILGYDDTIDVLVLNSWQRLELNDDLIVFKAKSNNIQFNCCVKL